MAKNIEAGKKVNDLYNYFINKEQGQYMITLYNSSENKTSIVNFTRGSNSTLSKNITNDLYDYTYDEDNVISVTNVEQLTAVRGTKLQNQYFLNSQEHCFLTPLKTFYLEKLETYKEGKSFERYRAALKHINKALIIYKNGICEYDIAMLCKKIKASIKIYSIVRCVDDSQLPIFEHNEKDATNRFEFYNTGSNHVDVLGGKVTEVDQLKENEDDSFCLTKYYGETITKQITKDGIKKLKNNKKTTFARFEKETGMENFKLCSIKDKEVSDFIFLGTMDTQTYDFKTIIRPGEKLPEYNSKYLINSTSKNIKGIDQIKAYTNCKDAPFYEGYPAKITDFRNTDKIVNIGLYEIVNLECSKLYRDLGYKDGVYTSADLKFLSNRGFTYKIVRGCWGTTFNFEHPEYMYDKCDLNKPYYCVHAGCSIRQSDRTRYECSKKLSEVLEIDHYTSSKKCIFTTKTQTNLHLSHIYAFVFAYVRLKSLVVIEKIIEKNGYNSLVRVCKDGIYYTGNEIYSEGWSSDKKIKLGNSESYFIEPSATKDVKCGPFKEFIKNNAYAGAGGTGKTHELCTDLGNVRMTYFAPSYKLMAEVTKKYNVSGSVHAVINYAAPMKHNIDLLNRSNVLLIDECSMITENQKNNILQKYPYHKIYFVGDPECQLPPFEEGASELKSMTFENLTVKKFTKYYRYDEKLENLQPMLRNSVIYNIPTIDKVISSFKTITRSQALELYTPDDIFLAYYNKRCEKYDKLLDHLEKYQYKASLENFFTKGQIVTVKPTVEQFRTVKRKLIQTTLLDEIITKENKNSDLNYIKRHGYTVHCVQGETFNGKIFIDVGELDNLELYKKLIYTAITRATTYENVFFIRNGSTVRKTEV